MATIPVKTNEATASRRRVAFHPVLATDGMTPSLTEAGGQPKISIDGGQWQTTGIGVLVDVHDTDGVTHTGMYYAELTQAIVNVANAGIRTWYKGTLTAQCWGDTAIVDSRLDEVTTVHGHADTLVTEMAKVPKSDSTVSWNATALAAINAQCDLAITDANFATDVEMASTFLHADLGDGTNDYVLNERTVRSALRLIRNWWSMSGTTLTVRCEDDSTVAWTATVTPDATANPIIGSNPTGP